MFRKLFSDQGLATFERWVSFYAWVFVVVCLAGFGILFVSSALPRGILARDIIKPVGSTIMLALALWLVSNGLPLYLACLPGSSSARHRNVESQQLVAVGFHADRFRVSLGWSPHRSGIWARLVDAIVGP
ncbi:MAG: hypothetical protein EHM23_33210 [Acidobacteria bacterium]|nr:MAG: hypothetical protein EHM23_33210 [Acidobacteriota bacterium]